MASSRATSSSAQNAGTPPEGRTMFTSTPSISMSRTRAWASKLTRALGNGGPLQRPSQGGAPFFTPPVTPGGGFPRPPQPHRQAQAGRLFTPQPVPPPLGVDPPTP